MASLNGLRIVVTRAAHQAEELAAPLRRLGGDVILLPAIAIGPPADSGPLQHAASRANDHDWIIFTSQNSIEAFVSYARLGEVQSFKVAAVGRATGQAAERHGLKVHLIPEKYTAESLADVFAVEDLEGKRILIPSAAVTRDVIPKKLEEQGAIVTAVEAYRNVLPDGMAERAALVFREPLPDWVLFASPSAVDNILALVPTQQLKKLKVASIGPVTSNAIANHGLIVTAEANPHDLHGLVAAVEQAEKFRVLE
jgi:uroporphyrinogen-III synthase